MLPDEFRLEIKQFLEKHSQGIALRLIKKKYPELHYYQIYNLLTELGYTIIPKKLMLERTVRFVIKGGNSNGIKRLGYENTREADINDTISDSSEEAF